VIYDLVKLDIEGPKARERQSKGRPPKDAEKLPENLPEDKGDARDKAAASVGWSGRTAEKASVVVETDDPELIQMMDEQSVDAAYKAMKEREEDSGSGDSSSEQTKQKRFSTRRITGLARRIEEFVSDEEYLREIEARVRAGFEVLVVSDVEELKKSVDKLLSYLNRWLSEDEQKHRKSLKASEATV
jgi:hypothetical protein